MVNANQPVRTCILKVDLKCCTGCQKKASEKLKNISGVKEVEYNSIKGLMKVTGDVDPEALTRKLTKHGRKTEVCSVKFQLDDDDDDLNTDTDEEEDTTSSGPDPKTMEREIIQAKMISKRPKKRSLFGCFTNKSELVQPLPMPNRNRYLNGPPPGYVYPYANAHTSSHFPPPNPMIPPPPYPPIMQPSSHFRPPNPMIPPPPYPPMMLQQMMQQQMMQQQMMPQQPLGGAAMPSNPNMFQPPNQSYFMDQQVVKLKNPKLHYT